jgi:general secretion pathway protein C
MWHTLLSSKKFYLTLNYALGAIALASTLVVARDVVVISATSQTTPSTLAVVSSTSSAQGKPLMYYAPVLRNNVFGFDAGVLSPINSAIGLPKTSFVDAKAVKLNIKVLGTVAWPDGFGYAIVGGAGQQEVFRQGDVIPNAGVLTQVRANAIVVDVAGVEHVVDVFKIAGVQGTIPPPAASGSSMWNKRVKKVGSFARQTGEGEYVVNRRAIGETIASPERMLRDARLLPNFVGGKQQGFKVLELVKGGLYEEIGLMNNDILIGVNDLDINTMEAALQAFNALQGMDRISLRVIRGGNKRSITYNVR